MKMTVEATRRLDDDEKGLTNLQTPGGAQQVTIISEPGVYRLIGRSNKPAAKAFNRWACHEVFPAIRKTGRYQAATAVPLAPTFANRRWIMGVSPDGRETAKAIDPEEFLCKLVELPGLIRDSGFLIEWQILVEILHACADRLAGKLAGRARRAA